MVCIKTKEQIEQSLTEKGYNRGLGFEAEMSRYCGRTVRVQARVTKCLDEKTGRLLMMKNPYIVLEHVVCAANLLTPALLWGRTYRINRRRTGGRGSQPGRVGCRGSGRIRRIPVPGFQTRRPEFQTGLQPHDHMRLAASSGAVGC